MKTNFLACTACFIISVFIILPGTAFCEPMILDDGELSEINAQAGPAVSGMSMNKDGEISQFSDEATAPGDMDDDGSRAAHSPTPGTINEMSELRDMNQFSNMGGGANPGGGASCH